MKMHKEFGVWVAVAAACFSGSTLQAADGTWTNLSGGLWSADGNWSGATVADGSGFTARFDTLDIAAGATTVNLDSARTIGTLIFGDTSTATAGNWILANNATPANVLTLGGAATITVDAMSSVTNTGTNVTISAIIDGTNGLTKNGTGTNTTGTNNTAGTGTLTLSGANTYTGATNINTGTIRATNSLAFGGVSGGKLTTNVVNVASGARLILANVSIANTVNLNGINALSVAGGNGTLSGIVNLQSNSSAYVHNGGNYILTLSGAVNLGSNVFTINTTGSNNGAVISGTLTGGSSSGITKNGNGPLTMSGDGSGYSGTTTLTQGEILVGSSNGLGTGTLALNLNNNALGTVRSNVATDRSIAAAVTIGNGIASRYAFGTASTGSLTFTNTTDISITGTKLFEVYQTNPGTYTQFNAGFVGTGGITKQTGTGTLILNGNSTYTGATNVNAGTLLVNGSLGSTAVSVANLATLGGTGSIAGTVNVASGGTLAPGASIESLATGALTLNTGSILALEINTSTLATDLVDVTGDLSITSGALLTLSDLGLDVILADGTTFNFLDYSGTWNGGLFTFGANELADDEVFSFGSNDYRISYNGFDNASSVVSLSVVAIPEPSTYALIGFGLGALAVLRRKKK